MRWQVHTPAWRRGFVLALACTALWGLVPTATKASLAAVDPDVLAFLRLVTAAAIFRVLGRSDTRADLRNRWVWLAGTALAGDFLLYSRGLVHTTASAAGLLVCLEPVATIALAVWLLGEQWNRYRAWGSALAVFGVGMAGSTAVGSEVATAPDAIRGNLLIATAAILWSVYAVAQRKTLGTGEWAGRLYAIFTVAALVALPFAAGHPKIHLSAPLSSWVAVAVLVLPCTGGVYMLYAQAQRLLEVSVLSLLLAGIPVLSLLCARVWLAEELSLSLLTGATFVVTGALVRALEPAEASVTMVEHRTPPRSCRE